MIKIGSTRITILMFNKAFKIPVFWNWKCFLNGILGNIQEKEFSTLDNELLAPVLFYIYGGLLIVMPKVDVDCSHDTLRQWIALANENPDKEILFSIVEKKIDSVGWLDNRIVAVDYGS